MTYTVSITRKAQKELATIYNPDYDRIKEATKSISENPRPSGCKKLTGRDGWRIRIGKYRIIYEIDDENKTVIVLHVGHRRNVYE